jgi:hypothetical protein
MKELGKVKKNVKLYDENNKLCMITNFVHYSGTEQIKFEIQYGYPFKIEDKVILIDEHKLDEFLNNYTTESKDLIKNKVMKDDLQISQNSDIQKQTNDNFQELRSTLFDVMKELKAGTMKPDQAKAISDTAQTIINSVKVEVDFMKNVRL